VLAVNLLRHRPAGNRPGDRRETFIAGAGVGSAEGRTVINISFAGPYDPMLQLAMKKAREKGAC